MLSGTSASLSPGATTNGPQLLLAFQSGQGLPRLRETEEKRNNVAQGVTLAAVVALASNDESEPHW